MKFRQRKITSVFENSIISVIVFTFLLLSLKTSAQNNWVKQLGGADSDIGAASAADLFNHVYTIGTFSGTASFGIYNLTSNGKADVFLTKANALDGEIEWVRQVGGMNEDNGNSVTCDPQGNVYFTGRFSGTIVLGNFTLTSSGTSDVFVIKLDHSTGAIVWANKLGGTGNDSGLSITSDASGNIYTSGYFQGTGSFGTFTLTPSGTNSNIFISRIDGASGNVIWAKGYGGSGYSYGNALSCDFSGNVYLIGNFESVVMFGTTTLTAVQYQDIFISKHYATTGNPAWAVNIGGSGNDNGNGITANPDGYIYTTGKFEGSCAFGSDTLISDGTADMFITKTNAISGAFVWTKQFGAQGYEQGNAIASDVSGKLFVTGQFNGFMDFGNFLLASAGNADGFIAKMDTSAHTLWASTLGGTGMDSGYGISTDANDGVYCTGAFQSTSAFNGQSLSSKGLSDAFVLRFAGTSVGVKNNLFFSNSIQVMPNPFTDYLTIKIKNDPSISYKITVTDMTGKIILRKESENLIQQLNLEELNAGIYFLEIKENNGARAVKKIVKN